MELEILKEMFLTYLENLPKQPQLGTMSMSDPFVTLQFRPKGVGRLGEI